MAFCNYLYNHFTGWSKGHCSPKAEHSARVEHGVTCSCPEGSPAVESSVLYYNVVFHCKASSVYVMYWSVEIATEIKLTSKLYEIHYRKSVISKL